jgi:SAM-dependent methyltransferase
MDGALRAYWKLYREGAALGRRQFGRAGIACAGLKRSLGFVIQPVENWSRYPELRSALDLLADIGEGERVLDLGSPKMLGFLLAARHAATFRLTDLWDTAVDEVRELERANRAHLAGRVELATADLTALAGHADGEFDRVFSVSVIEHIEDLAAVYRGLNEMARVLRPGGRAVVSVPVEPAYRAEYRTHEVYGKGHDMARVFFSHYFDREGLAGLLAAAPALRLETLRFSRWHVEKPHVRAWTRVPRKIRGLLGPVNLLLAPSATTLTEPGWDALVIDGPGDVIMRFRRD